LGLIGSTKRVVEGDLCSLSALSLLNHHSQLLIILKVTRAAGFDDHGEEVIEHDIIYERESNGDPHESEQYAESLLDNDGNNLEEGINMRPQYNICSHGTYEPQHPHKALVYRFTAHFSFIIIFILSAN